MSDDRQAIVDVTYRYCWAIDDRRWEALADVFTPTATADLGARCEGLDGIVERISAALTPLDASHHMVTNHVVEVDGDEARCRCYVQAQHVCLGAEGGDHFLLGGRYRDRLERTAGGWLIAERVLQVSWTEGNLAVLGERRR